MSYQTDVSRTLWRVTFSESLTTSDLFELRKSVEAVLHGEIFGLPNGLVDLRGISDSNIGFGTLSIFTSIVRDYPLSNEVRIAIIASAPFQYGYARMFQILLEHQQVEIEVFKDEDVALEWLINNTG